MARIRSIKPSFFNNEELAECDPLARLLFIGLWTIADSEGKLEDRPKRIKASILPYDNVNIESLLNQLQTKLFIHRYVNNSERYIIIPKFIKHQTPHWKEPKSIIPDCDTTSSILAQDCSNVGSSMTEDCSNLLICIQDPGSSTRDLKEEEKREEYERGEEEEHPQKKVKEDATPYIEILDLYHDILPELPKVNRLTELHKGHLKKHWVKEQKSLEWWTEFFQRVKASDHLCCRIDGHTWSADFEWLIKPANFTKILNGRYDNKKPTNVYLQAARDGPGKTLQRLHGLFQEAKEERQCKTQITPNSAN